MRTSGKPDMLRLTNDFMTGSYVYASDLRAKGHNALAERLVNQALELDYETRFIKTAFNSDDFARHLKCAFYAVTKAIECLRLAAAVGAACVNHSSLVESADNIQRMLRSSVITVQSKSICVNKAVQGVPNVPGGYGRPAGQNDAKPNSSPDNMSISVGLSDNEPDLSECFSEAESIERSTPPLCEDDNREYNPDCKSDRNSDGVAETNQCVTDCEFAADDAGRVMSSCRKDRENEAGAAVSVAVEEPVCELSEQAAEDRLSEADLSEEDLKDVCSREIEPDDFIAAERSGKRSDAAGQGRRSVISCSCSG